MNYQEYRENRQSQFNALPIFFAFGKEQFRIAMEERGLTENDTDKVYSLPYGGLYLKKDTDVIRAYFNQPDELPELMKDYTFAKDAFAYEIANHEYIYNWEGDYDVLACFYNIEYQDDYDYEDYLIMADATDDTIRAFKDARCEYLRYMEEQGY